MSTDCCCFKLLKADLGRLSLTLAGLALVLSGAACGDLDLSDPTGAGAGDALDDTNTGGTDLDDVLDPIADVIEQDTGEAGDDVGDNDVGDNDVGEADSGEADVAGPDTGETPPASTLCNPCSKNEDCANSDNADAACVSWGAAGNFCGSLCVEDADCGVGFACVASKDVDDADVKQCKPKDDAECTCSEQAIKDKLQTTCGDPCAGKRTCGDAGLSACDAPNKGDEKCDGIDNDCDGTTDNGTCDDSDPCTVDACDGTECKHTPAEGACDDNDACTADDKCAAGKCTGAAKNCDDGKACTADTCDAKTGECANAAIAAGDVCDDGDGCTIGDKCDDAGACVGSEVNCDDGNACTADSCDKAAGNCANAALNEGDACDDNNVCTHGDACTGGLCLPGQLTNCDDDNACTADSCDVANGCQYSDNDGSGCEDGSSCTAGDICQSGNCLPGLPKECTGTTQCADAACNDFTGACQITKKVDQTQCDDGNACTTGDACATGACVGDVDDCDDGESCTKDACDPTKGCSNEALTGACDDGNKCTLGDTCVAAKCTADKTADCDDANKCTVDSCNPATGECETKAIVAPCDDGNACTADDACADGKCAGAAKVCDDNNPCTNDSCKPDSGCVNDAHTQPCNDGDKCTADDACKEGKCVGTDTSEHCDDGNVCTKDVCNAQYGCLADNIEGACDDGNTCTAVDACKEGKCIGLNNQCGCKGNEDCAAKDDGDLCNGSLICDTGFCAVDPNSVIICDTSGDSVCSLNTCDAKTGQCAAVARNDGKSCDADSSVCTQGDVCGKGLCVAGNKVDCNDKNSCTADSCDPTKGCLYKVLDGLCDDGTKCTEKDLCKEGKCVSGAPPNCDDGNSCTNDSCDTDKGCVNANNDQICSDGDACTAGDKCKAGVCTPLAKKDCNDNDTCTADSCSADSGCVNKPVADAKCSDGNQCTVGDACKEGKCIPGAKLDCDDKNQCTTDSCSVKGGCVHLELKGGCDDGDACTSGDMCVGKTCTPGGKALCDDKNPCTIDGCDKVKGCVNKPVADKTECSDGNLCTTGDMCIEGKCAGKVNTCNDDNPCTADICDKESGKCLHKLLSKTPCDDGMPCTIKTLCMMGKCGGGVMKACDDEKFCTKDSCDPKSGECIHLPIEGCVEGCKLDSECLQDKNPCTKAICAAGKCVMQSLTDVKCEDGNKCTSGDMCIKGVCMGKTKLCIDKNPCTLDSCDKLSGECKFSPVKPGSLCEDGNKCTIGEACQLTKGGMLCTGGKKVDCDDNKPCTADACNALTGACVNKPLAVGAACDDGIMCTPESKCVYLGKTLLCLGKVLNCDDKNSCTTDYCDKATGKCVNKAVPAGSKCSDGNACTLLDTCKLSKSGMVCTGLAKKCDDGKPCTADSCNTKTGDCLHKTLADGATCDDGDKCTSGDKCKNVGLITLCVGAKVNCDDKNVCTADSCSPKLGCLHKNLLIGASCEDGNKCTVGDTCQGTLVKGGIACKSGKATVCNDNNPCTTDKCSPKTGLCVFTNLAVGAVCDDGSKCTSDDKCASLKLGMTCVGKTVDCADKNTCTVDGCSPKVGCLHKYLAVGSKCSDGNLCTLGDTCQPGLLKGSTVCKSGKPKLCNDKNPCTTDMCSAKTGLCVYTPLKAGTTCSDGNACTTGDKCTLTKSGMLCKGSSLNCDDKNSCTVDSCSIKAGCLHKPLAAGASCDDGKPCTVGEICVVTKSGMLCSGPPKNCNDGKKCTTDSCNAVTGACVHKPILNCVEGCKSNAECDDGKKCTSNICLVKTGVCLFAPKVCKDDKLCTNDSCSEKDGLCHFTPKTCNDSKICTTDSCDAATGKCKFTPIKGCCTAVSQCNDSDECTTELCIKNKCLHLNKTCNDNNLCTSDSCNKSTGACVFAPKLCLTKNKCVVPGCDAADGQCKYPPKNCDDKNVCTADSCDALTGACKNTPIAGCCNLNSQCKDTSACTVDLCLSHKCAHLPVICKGQTCKTAKCDTVKGCVYTDLDCDDKNACTTDYCSSLDGKCKHTAIKGCCNTSSECDDKKVCTTDSCNKLHKCTYTPKSPGTTCGIDMTCKDANSCLCTRWNKSATGDGSYSTSSEYLWDVVQSKKGYDSYAVGYRHIGTTHGYEGLVIKRDQWGGIIWSKTFNAGTSGKTDRFYAAVPTSDGGLWAVGDTSKTGNYQGWVVRISAGGSVTKSLLFGGSSSDYLYDAHPYGVDGLVVAGRKYVSGKYRGWVMWLNKDGVLTGLKERTITKTKSVYLYGVTHSAKGITVVSGYTDVDGKLNYVGFISTWTALGSYHSYQFGGTGGDYLRRVTMAYDPTSSATARIAAVGNSSSTSNGGYDGWLVTATLNSNGTLSSPHQFRYGGSDYDFFWDVARSKAGHVLAVGYTASSGAGGSDGWALEANYTTGVATPFAKTYGGTKADYLYAVGKTTYGEWLMSGKAASYNGTTSTDTWQLSVSSAGATTCSLIIKPPIK